VGIIGSTLTKHHEANQRASAPGHRRNRRGFSTAAALDGRVIPGAVEELAAKPGEFLASGGSPPSEVASASKRHQGGPMKARLVCGRCGASSAQRRDQVSESAHRLYLLHVASAALLSRKTSGTDYPRPLYPVPASPLEFRSSHKGFRGTSRRGGRPALSPGGAAPESADRKRRLRAGIARSLGANTHVRMTDTTANRVPEHKGEHSWKRNEKEQVTQVRKALSTAGTGTATHRSHASHEAIADGRRKPREFLASGGSPPSGH